MNNAEFAFKSDIKSRNIKTLAISLLLFIVYFSDLIRNFEKYS
jgi:hypothetical protein